MKYAPMPANDDERLKIVHQLGILDTPPEERFDSFTKEAVEKLRVPISMISIIDKDREWFKSCQGLDVKESPRNISFCGHAMMASDIFIVEDTLKDERFRDNPQVMGKPFIRFYAGIALHEALTSAVIGVFCIKDTKPRELSLKDLDIFMDIARRAELEINKK